MAGVNGVSYSEMKAAAELTGWAPSIFEVEAIRAMSGAYLDGLEQVRKENA